MNELTTLSTLAVEINFYDDQANNLADQALVCAAKCGERLLRVKNNLQAGEFVAWVEGNTTVKKTKAYGYVKIATEMPELLGDSFRTCGMGVRHALELLSAPEEIREEVTAKIEAGEDVTVKEIQRLKKEASDAQLKAESLQNDLIGKTQALDASEAKVRFQALTVESVEKQNNELRNRDQSLIDAKVSEAKAVLILENQQAIAEAKRQAENSQCELERLKREQEKAIEHGVKIELGKLETEINQKRYQIEVNARELEDLKKVRRELDAEVGALAVHKDAIKSIKIELASLTMEFSNAFDTGTIPNEVTGDWSAIYDALSKLLTQMAEWRGNSALIGELVD